MDFQLFSVMGRKAVYFIIQILILLFCLWFVEFIYYKDIYPDKRVKENFEQVDCRILNKTLESRGRVFKSYRGDILLNYTTNENTPFSVWTSVNGLNRSFTTNQASQEDLLSQFDMNSTYPCWYNPQKPEQVVIVLRHNWTSTFPLFIPSVIAIIMLYSLSKISFEFFGNMALKRREKRANKKL